MPWSPLLESRLAQPHAHRRRHGGSFGRASRTCSSAAAGAVAGHCWSLLGRHCGGWPSSAMPSGVSRWSQIAFHALQDIRRGRVRGVREHLIRFMGALLVKQWRPLSWRPPGSVRGNFGFLQPVPQCVRRDPGRTISMPASPPNTRAASSRALRRSPRAGRGRATAMAHPRVAEGCCCSGEGPSSECRRQLMDDFREHWAPCYAASS
ncbi:hypothetical protein BU16DRAFT_101781 [Lophium mytilinum]|uniref:Uncharacterized protein n=1 Tax=Lophium mytilinum TaxID=390894 RepID=A0A6A6QIX2_9PEZI|nr:hypothetical protein BU16DRAFT_101781 [Lophium mytilinum]